jgi:molecular chaperone DnaJ
MDKDLYKILGVKEDATDAVIKKAYRDLAKKFHPDRTGGDKSKEARFKDISAAYDVLSDPKKRQQYDMLRQGNFATAAGPGGGAGFDPSQFGGNLEDILAQMFGGMRGGPGGGRARVRTQTTRGPQVIFETDSWDDMPFGGGARRSPPEETYRLPDGTLLARKGADVYGDVTLSVDEAVLGTKVDVTTLSGGVSLTIPAGTSSGQKLRLRGKGPEGGDHYVTVQIKVPKDVPDRAKELIAEFGRLTRPKKR